MAGRWHPVSASVFALAPDRRARHDAAVRGVVADPAGREPQAIDVSLPAVRSAASVAVRAHAARPRGRLEPAASRPHRVRDESARGRTASAPGGLGGGAARRRTFGERRLMAAAARAHSSAGSGPRRHLGRRRLGGRARRIAEPYRDIAAPAVFQSNRERLLLALISSRRRLVPTRARPEHPRGVDARGARDSRAAAAQARRAGARRDMWSRPRRRSRRARRSSSRSAATRSVTTVCGRNPRSVQVSGELVIRGHFLTSGYWVFFPRTGARSARVAPLGARLRPTNHGLVVTIPAGAASGRIYISTTSRTHSKPYGPITVLAAPRPPPPSPPRR